MLPELPEYAIREAFDKRDVKMDDVRVSRSQEARAGAVVRLYTRYGEEARQIEVLYDDENLLIIRNSILRAIL